MKTAGHWVLTVVFQRENPHHSSDSPAKYDKRDSPYCFPIPDKRSERESPKHCKLPADDSQAPLAHQSSKRERRYGNRSPWKEITGIAERREKGYAKTTVGHGIKESMRCR